VVVIVIALAHGIATVILGRKVEGRIEAYKAKGEPVSMADLAGSPIPDSENGAVILDKVQRDLREYRKKEAKEWQRTLNRYHTSGKKPPESDEDLAQNIISAGKDKKESPEIWAAAIRYAAPAAAMLPRIEEAAAKLQCRYKANWQDGIDALFPYMGGIKNITRTLAIKSCLDAKAGKIEETVRSMTDAYKLEESIKEEPSLIGLLVRVALTHMNSYALQNAAGYGHIDKTHARKLYDALENIDIQRDTAVALNGERAFHIWEFKAATKRGKLYAGGGSNETWLGNPGIEKVIRSYMWRPMLYADELSCLDLLDGYLSIEKWTYREIKSQRIDDRFMSDIPSYAFVTRIDTPVYAKVLAKRDTGIARISGDQIFLALLAYKDSFGQYPGTLDELRSKLGWKLREDPFSGKDFVYKREGNGFLLYSIGENLKDDGGLATYDRPATPGTASPGYDDITWRMEK